MKLLRLLFIIALLASKPTEAAAPPSETAFYPVHRVIKSLVVFVPIVTLLAGIPYGISCRYLAPSSQNSVFGLIIGATASNGLGFLGSALVLWAVAADSKAFLESFLTLPTYAIIGFSVALITVVGETVFIAVAGVEMATNAVATEVREWWGTEIVCAVFATAAMTTITLLYPFRMYHRAMDTPALDEITI